MTFVPMELGDHISQGIFHQLSVTPENKDDIGQFYHGDIDTRKIWTDMKQWSMVEMGLHKMTVYHRSSWLKAVAFFRTVPSPPTPHRKLSL